MFQTVAGYFLSFDSPCILHTSLALRQAIWRKDDPRWHVCGVPEVLYTDNGSDFRSHHLEQVGADLKMQLVFSTPGAPRGRGRIERFLGTLKKMFLSSLPGYKSPAGGIRGKASMTLVELDGLLRTLDHILHNPGSKYSPADTDKRSEKMQGFGRLERCTWASWRIVIMPNTAQRIVPNNSQSNHPSRYQRGGASDR